MGFFKRLKDIFNKNIDCGDEIDDRIIFRYNKKWLYISKNIFVRDHIACVIVYKGRVCDIIYSGKGEDTLVFKANASDMIFEQVCNEKTRKGTKDLIIIYGDGDRVTIKNYFVIDKDGVPTGINSSVKKARCL